MLRLRAWPQRWLRAGWRAAWAIAILFVVGVPLLMLALAGLPHVFRSSLVRNVIAHQAGELPAVSDPAFAQTLTLLTGAKLAAGSAVEVLSNGDDTFEPIWEDLASAQRSITVQIYYLGAGTVMDRTTRALAARARAGVKVYVLYDAFGAADFPRRELDLLRQSGVKTAEFRPFRWYVLDRASHRTHVRGIVIDGAVGYTGGFGLDDKWLGAGRLPGEWRDTNARFTGSAVAQLQAAFVAQWAEATGELLAGEHFLAARDSTPAARAQTAPVTLLYSPAVTGSTSAERVLALTIASARRRLYLSNAYFIPDADFMQLLTDAARRGVDVRVLTNGERTDVKTVLLAGRNRYEALLEAGVRIYEYQPTAMHAKTFVVDGLWVGITTMNFDNRSMAYNNEVALLCLDPAVAATMESLFMEDIRFADEIQLQTFRRRSWLSRLSERAANVVSSLL
ncbi:MAG: phospholipase D-like domain-containing protein [Rubrivivax sp.]